jgi:2-oxoglutarate ferredoxin oxidoreductase subunit gamma
MKRTEVRLSGEGGQGIVLGGIILAEAAAIYDGTNALQTQSYGPESRGGASRAEVIISDGEIDYPKVDVPDVLLVMNQVAYDKFASAVKEDGIIIADSTHVKVKAGGPARVFSAPITGLARELGREIVANIVALGVLVALTGMVSRESLERAVLARVPKGTEDLNRRALAAGFAAAAREE